MYRVCDSSVGSNVLINNNKKPLNSYLYFCNHNEILLVIKWTNISKNQLNQMYLNSSCKKTYLTDGLFCFGSSVVCFCFVYVCFFILFFVAGPCGALCTLTIANKKGTYLYFVQELVKRIGRYDWSGSLVKFQHRLVSLMNTIQKVVFWKKNLVTLFIYFSICAIFAQSTYLYFIQ